MLMKLPLAIAFCLVASPVLADIVQTLHSSSATTSSSFGQSFTPTASESQVSGVSFYWNSEFNLALHDPVMKVELRSGVGYLGALLATKTIPPIPDSTPEFTWI